jgi:hypothetical protein
MIQLKVGGKIKFFNLKDHEREKNLFEARYAMSDMPKYLSKHLKITTDKDEHLSYTIGEIEDCIFIDADYVESKPLEEEEVKKGLDVSHLSYSAEEAKGQDSKTVEELFDKYFPYKSDISKDIKKMLCKSFSDLSLKTLKKFFEFTSKVMAAGYLIAPNNEVINGIIRDILLGPDDDDIDKYVERYIEDRKRKRLC